MMRSAKHLKRTDRDIKVAADLWCRNRAAAEERYGNISDWDVSNVTDMSQLFRGQDPGGPMEDRFQGKDFFDDDIGDWDVSKVTNMYGMFWGALTFDLNITRWDMRHVTNKSDMIDGARVMKRDNKPAPVRDDDNDDSDSDSDSDSEDYW
jgi:hypothetical protein